MNAAPTISAGFVRISRDTLQARGLAVAELFAAAGLDPAELAQADARFPARQVDLLWQLAAQRSGDPAIGLAAYEHASPACLHIVGYSMLSSPSLRGALERLIRFHPILGDAAVLSLCREGAGYRFSATPAAALGSPSRQFGDAGLAVLLACVRRMVDGSQIRPLQVEFAYPAPDDSAAYRTLLDCPIRFGCGRLSLLFAAAELERPLHTADQLLSQLHDSLAEQYLSDLASAPLARRLARLLRERLADGELGMEEIAAQLGLNKRTLQRRLSEEGTTFREQLDAVRRRQAELYLRHPHFSAERIAELLGFREHGNFFRACRRWFGCTPALYRSRLGAPRQPD